jgi:hypothetical protein
LRVRKGSFFSGNHAPGISPDQDEIRRLAATCETGILETGHWHDHVEFLMKSPFPGMDPYIEACGLWGDFHHNLISEIQHALAQVASDRYLVRAEERSYVVLVEEDGKKTHPFVPDVSVTTERRKRPSRRKGGTAVAEPPFKAEPVLMRAFVEEEHREAFVEIYEATPEQRLVTCIEVLSPSNKRPHSPGWDLYLPKRQSPLLGEANLVEIDLLRGGQRMPMLDPWPDSPYTVLVARAKNTESAGSGRCTSRCRRFRFPWQSPTRTSCWSFSR